MSAAFDSCQEFPEFLIRNSCKFLTGIAGIIRNVFSHQEYQIPDQESTGTGIFRNSCQESGMQEFLAKSTAVCTDSSIVPPISQRNRVARTITVSGMCASCNARCCTMASSAVRLFCNATFGKGKRRNFLKWTCTSAYN